SRTGMIYIASPNLGVWCRHDGAATWNTQSKGLPAKPITSLATHASEDEGATWQLMDGGPENMTGPFIHSNMPGSMQSGWLLAVTRNGVSRSMDCFCLWRRAGGLAGEVSGLTYDPR
ncbi:MAG: hypothetical protein ACI8PT_000001, partial [Gammaproteobacteria bacterium]